MGLEASRDRCIDVSGRDMTKPESAGNRAFNNFSVRGQNRQKGLEPFQQNKSKRN